MTWWCSATRLPWDWSPRAYPGVWAAMVAMLATYLALYRHPPGNLTGPEDRRRPWAFVGGWAVLWAASDWPIGTLGGGYLASAHMLQYLLYTLVAAPLLVLGVPDWMLRRALTRSRTYPFVRAACRPVVAVVTFNVVLIATHAPITVDALRTSQLGSFVLDAAWLAAGILLWLPICGALDELRPSYPSRAVLLFLAAGVIPMIPGGFLTFAPNPLYATYELAPRVGMIDALADQQLAGVLMKVGSIPLIWPVIGALFFRWAREDQALERHGARRTPGQNNGSTESGTEGSRAA